MTTPDRPFKSSPLNEAVESAVSAFLELPQRRLAEFVVRTLAFAEPPTLRSLLSNCGDIAAVDVPDDVLPAGLALRQVPSFKTMVLLGAARTVADTEWRLTLPGLEIRFPEGVGEAEKERVISQLDDLLDGARETLNRSSAQDVPPGPTSMAP